ncbi:hypothetical protein [Paenibacillus polymyxa]|uniref:hypothetical protein n=1 Tax=Paenibacillus polymyxa TaxID=1406 RepID=UPI00287F8642|nr:hypothetical protein [Paenibacillus polymyxa]
MRIETSQLAKDHLEYVKQNATEMQTYNTITDHFYYYLTSVRRLLPDTASGIVADFKADMTRQ